MPKHNETRQILARKGFEIWAKWDSAAEIWELFTEREAEAYIGDADTIPAAKAFAAAWLADRLAQ